MTLDDKLDMGRIRVKIAFYGKPLPKEVRDRCYNEAASEAFDMVLNDEEEASFLDTIDIIYSRKLLSEYINLYKRFHRA